MADREDRIEDWIRTEDAKAEKRASVVPPSSDQIHGEEPSPGEVALVALSQWMADEPEVPIVELAVMSTEVILLTFGDQVELPDPFYTAEEDSPVIADSWQITIEDARTLDGGEDLGSQMMALVGVGNTINGDQAFFNTTRWGAFGIAGTEEWVHKALISQAMVQAAQMWSRDQHIWLVGLGDTAEKLIHLMRPYHPETHFHTAETLGEIGPQEIDGTSATIYIAGSTPQTYPTFKAMGLLDAGIMTDSIVNHESMFMSEGEDGSVVIGPTGHMLYPNVVDDVIEMLDLAWDQAQQIDQQAIDEAASTDYDAVLNKPTSESPVSIGDDVDAAFAEIMGNANLAENLGKDIEAEYSTTASATPFDEPGTEDGETAESRPESPPQQQKGAGAADEKDDAEDERQTAPGDASEVATAQHGVAPEPDTDGQVTNEPPDDAQNEDRAAEPEVAHLKDTEPEKSGSEITSLLGETPRLQLLGPVEVSTNSGSLDGRHAETLAFLHLTDGPVAVQEISATIWPADEPEGRNARTRRSRLLSKIRNDLDVITVDDGHWSVEPLPSDMDLILQTLEQADRTPATEMISACAHVDVPLRDAGPWAETFQKEITGQLREALEAVKQNPLMGTTVTNAAAAALERVSE